MDISKVRPDSAEKIQEGKVRGTSHSKRAHRVENHPAHEIGAAKNDSQQIDKVRLSSDAKMIQEGVEAARAAPDARAEKVAALKDAIKNGTYKADSQAVAEKMLRSSLEEDILTRME